MKTLPKIKETKSIRGKEMIIVDDLYLFNLKRELRDKTKHFQCTQYKASYKCQAYFKIKNIEIIEYNNTHNHETVLLNQTDR